MPRWGDHHVFRTPTLSVSILFGTGLALGMVFGIPLMILFFNSSIILMMGTIGGLGMAALSIVLLAVIFFVALKAEWLGAFFAGFVVGLFINFLLVTSFLSF